MHRLVPALCLAVAASTALADTPTFTLVAENGRFIPSVIEVPADTRFRLEVDGVPVAEDVPVPTLGKTTGELQVGIFVEGEPGRSCSVSVDDVEVIKRERQ